MKNWSQLNQPRRVRSLLILLVCLLTIYAPVELTRVIIAWDLSGQFLFEVLFIWVLYAIAMFLISVLVAQKNPEQLYGGDTQSDQDVPRMVCHPLS